MNLGFFGFPDKFNSNVLDIKQFDTSGVYYPPEAARYVYMFAVAGGGGGGGGGRRAASINSYGGGGGSGGAQYIGFLPDELLSIRGLYVIVNIGTGGTSGAAAATDTTTGGTGGNAGNTVLYYGGLNVATNEFLNLLGGAGGTGGSNGSGLAGATRTAIFNGTLGTNVAAMQGSPNIGNNLEVQTIAYNGGGGGGGVNTANNAGGGSSIVLPTINTTNPSCIFYDETGPGVLEAGTVLTGGAVNGGAAGQNSTSHIFTKFSSGFGGAGGGGGSTAAASNGGSGYRGGGGGGGGGARNGITAGLGGAGGNGYAIFVAMR